MGNDFPEEMALELSVSMSVKEPEQKGGEGQDRLLFT